MFDTHNRLDIDLELSSTAYNVLALPEGSHYLGPVFGAADLCQCSTVAYSAISACGLCQNRTITRWVITTPSSRCRVIIIFKTSLVHYSWSTWATNCETVSIST